MGCQLMQMVVNAVGDNLNLTYCSLHGDPQNSEDIIQKTGFS